MSLLDVRLEDLLVSLLDVRLEELLVSLLDVRLEKLLVSLLDQLISLKSPPLVFKGDLTRGGEYPLLFYQIPQKRPNRDDWSLQR